MRQKPIGDVIRDRVPPLILKMVIIFILYFINLVAPPLVEGVSVPGISIAPYNSASWLIWVVSMMFLVVSFVRAMSDILALIDPFTDLVIKQIGVREERSLCRIAKELIYIVLAILLAEALSPFLLLVPKIGSLMDAVVSLIVLGIILLLIYDIGRVLYRLMKYKAKAFADQLARKAEEIRGQ